MKIDQIDYLIINRFSNWTPPLTLPSPKFYWEHLLNISKFKVQICPFTCRPFSFIDRKPWRFFLFCIIGDLKNPFISTSKMIGLFVESFEKYPTLNELIIFIFEKYSNKLENPFSTLQSNIFEFILDRLNDYEDIFNKISPQEFIKRFNQSNKPSDREHFENRYL